MSPAQGQFQQPGKNIQPRILTPTVVLPAATPSKKSAKNPTSPLKIKLSLSGKTGRVLTTDPQTPGKSSGHCDGKPAGKQSDKNKIIKPVPIVYTAPPGQVATDTAHKQVKVGSPTVLTMTALKNRPSKSHKKSSQRPAAVLAETLRAGAQVGRVQTIGGVQRIVLTPCEKPTGGQFIVTNPTVPSSSGQPASAGSSVQQVAVAQSSTPRFRSLQPKPVVTKQVVTNLVRPNVVQVNPSIMSQLQAMQAMQRASMKAHASSHGSSGHGKKRHRSDDSAPRPKRRKTSGTSSFKQPSLPTDMVSDSCSYVISNFSEVGSFQKLCNLSLEYCIGQEEEIENSHLAAKICINLVHWSRSCNH